MEDLRRLTVLSATPEPHKVVYLAMHQDYSAGFVQSTVLTEEKCAEIVVRELLNGGRGHYGPFEHAFITFNCGYYDHDTIMQWLRHRLLSADCQSFRYTSESILNVANGSADVEEGFYFRPVGHYTDRHGKKYEYTEEMRQEDIEIALSLAKHYQKRISQGISEEHARGLVPGCRRQHCVITLNARMLMHILNVRAKKDVQLEARHLANELFRIFSDWMPQTAKWYEAHLLGKAKLAP